jgi:hypothetical protein
MSNIFNVAAFFLLHSKIFHRILPQNSSICVPDTGRAWLREKLQPLTEIEILSSVPHPVTTLIVISAENCLNGMYRLR